MLLHKPGDNERGDKFARLSERYKSSPDFFPEDTKVELTNWNKKKAPNILKYTSKFYFIFHLVCISSLLQPVTL